MSAMVLYDLCVIYMLYGNLLYFLYHAAELLTTNKLSELACLALYLMYEKKQGKDSFWYPYIKELDRQRGRGQLAVESPLLWTESELDYLNGSPMRVSIFYPLYVNLSLPLLLMQD